MCIVGEAGVGKSMICEKYANMFPSYDIDVEQRLSKTIKPVLLARVPAKASDATLATSLLAALGDPAYSQGTSTNKTFRLKALLKECGVELIIIDEVQHIYDRDSQKIIQVASNWIKDLIVETRIPTILTGLPDLITVVERNEQLNSRFKYRERLSLFDLSNPNEEKIFRSFLYVVDLKLPLIQRSNLADPDTALMLFEASGGQMRTLMEQILLPATLRALEQNAIKLSKEIIVNEINRLHGTTKICMKEPNKKCKPKKKSESVFRKAVI